MKLTKAEQEQIQTQRAKPAADRKRVAAARAYLLQLRDETALQIAEQLHSEYKRISGPPPRCTCDQQWTNPKCPAHLAGWTGMDCDVRPAPIARLTVKL